MSNGHSGPTKPNPNQHGSNLPVHAEPGTSHGSGHGGWGHPGSGVGADNHQGGNAWDPGTWKQGGSSDNTHSWVHPGPGVGGDSNQGGNAWNPGTWIQGGSNNGPNGISPQKQSIYDMMKQTLKSWGLGDLYKYALSYLQQGYSSDEVQLKLQETPEWKQRFAGNELRQKAGLRVLSPAEYLGLEDSYRQVLRQYGLPRGFYDNKNATDQWIGGDVSPSELQSRAQTVSDLVTSNPDVLAEWNRYYGSGKGGAIAAILDSKTALPLVQQRALAAQIGGSAMDQGLQVSRARAEQFVQSGVSLSQARQAYQDIATRLPVDQSIAHRFGTSFGQGQEESATILGNGDAVRKQNLIYSEEAGQFGGHGGASSASNNVATNI